MSKIIVSIKPVEKSEKWRVLAQSKRCRILYTRLSGYRVLGIEARDPASCIQDALAERVLECRGPGCGELSDCRGYLTGSSSLIAFCGDVVAKLYLVQPLSNPEPEILSLLAGKDETLALAGWLSLGGEVAGVLASREEGRPLAEKALEEAKSYDSLGGIDVLSRAASLLARLDKLLSVQGPWKNCVVKLSDRATWYLARLPRSIASILASIVLEELKGFEGSENAYTVCQLVHQDPHLYQFIEAGDGLKLIDFNGEPLRAPSLGPYEPAIRDLAVLLRSASYIAAMAAQSTSRRQGPLEWLEASIAEAIETYLAWLGPSDPGSELAILGPLVAERLAYEAWYERVYETGMLGIVLETARYKELWLEIRNAARR